MILNGINGLEKAKPRSQNPPGFGPWGFDSPSRHQHYLQLNQAVGSIPPRPPPAYFHTQKSSVSLKGVQLAAVRDKRSATLLADRVSHCPKYPPLCAAPSSAGILFTHGQNKCICCRLGFVFRMLLNPFNEHIGCIFCLQVVRRTIGLWYKHDQKSRWRQIGLRQFQSVLRVRLVV